MGRGRAKAKQTKVARELKYSTTATDLERLQRELSGGADPFALAGEAPPNAELDDEALDEDPYAGEDDEQADLAR